MRLDKASTVSRVRVDECHTIITVLIRHDVGITSSLPLRKSFSRHDENRATDYLPGLHTTVFQGAVNSNNPGKLRFNFAVATDPVLVHRLRATRYPQVEVAKIGVKKHVCYIKSRHLYPSQHG